MSIYLYTGEGGGKTTNALGLALRSLGHGHKVVIIQFLKWWKNTGEYKFQKFKGISNYYKIYQFGRKGWHGFKKLTKKDRELTENALNFAQEIVKKEKPKLLILDEINLVVYLKLLDEEQVINTIKQIQKSNKRMDIVLTGRHATKGLVNLSDYVNKISMIKMPKKLESKKGIQY
ncbi:MAG: cob(I)yrinic acid a,c-diamide adenosyltransferase [Candidatus Pacearchaeota archaeon]|nr:cob(I)yrinic acid a,c-diamide adenosyltransferase [Candidatus Pacearchaeota archaeon]